MQVPAPARRVRFGAFEADLHSGELRKHGLKIKLQDQPFQILALLLERPGEVVTREELQHKLWPADTFVDFDVGLNTAIKRLRDALGDTAEHPRYVDTLPRRGYRFIAAVEEAAVEPAPAAPVAPSAPVTEEPTAMPMGEREAAAPAKQGTRPNLWIVAGAVVTVVVLLVSLNIGGWRQRVFGRAGAARIQSIAVLPLENLSGDPSQDYFVDGMTDVLITDLAQLSALRVISRTSVMHYKGTKKTLPEIARELNVDAVVEGAVVRSGNRVRIDAQLIHAPTDRHLWAKSYERDLSDIVALQNEVARAVARQIEIKLTPQNEARLANARPVNPEAYEAYLEGRYFYNKLELEGWKKSIEYFDRAIAKDPTWALPYAGLAGSYWPLGINKALPNELCRKAEAAASEALKRDDASAEAHEWLAMIEFVCDWDWSSPEREFRRAIELNPSLGEAHSQFGRYLQAMGRTNEGLAETKRGVELDPLSNIARWERAHSLYLTGQYDAAAEQCWKMLKIDPNNPSGHQNLGDNYVLMGNLAEGIQELEKAVTLPGSSPRAVARLGYAYAVAGRRNDAQRMLDQLKDLSKKEIMYVHPDLVAAVYAGLGQKQEAFAWLEKAYQVRGNDVIDLRYDPHFASLRSDPRFADLVRRVGLPP